MKNHRPVPNILQETRYEKTNKREKLCCNKVAFKLRDGLFITLMTRKMNTSEEIDCSHELYGS